MKFLISYYNHDPLNTPKLARYFDAQRKNMEQLGYADDLLIICNEALEGVAPFAETPLPEYQYRYYSKYFALKQALSLGEAVLMMDHDLFITRRLTLPEDMHTPKIYSSAVVREHFSEQMALFTTGTYATVCAHVEALPNSPHMIRDSAGAASRHDNCFSSEGTQYNKVFYDTPKERLFRVLDNLIGTTVDSFSTQTLFTLDNLSRYAQHKHIDAVHTHIKVSD
jgi:hypothetical protein